MRTYLVTGVASEESLAWGVARRLLERGHSCIVAALPSNVRRARRLMRAYGAEDAVLPLDVCSEASLAELGAHIEQRNTQLDGVLHAIAYAPMEDLAETVCMVSRAGFLTAFEVSVYSLSAVLRVCMPSLRSSASVVALTYQGSQRVMQDYGIMGPAKAALECLVRYLASDLGASGIRVNSVSPGPVLTLAASVFPGIESKLEQAANRSPLRQRTTHEQVAETVEFLLGNGAAGITGQCIHVDQGLSILGG